jgi:hypothetical protein
MAFYFVCDLARRLRRHRFPPPWAVEDNGTCFIVRDHNGLRLAYCLAVATVGSE